MSYYIDSFSKSMTFIHQILLRYMYKAKSLDHEKIGAVTYIIIGQKPHYTDTLSKKYTEP